MDKEQVLHSFWSSFGVPAYDENSVPDAKKNAFPYITYEVQTDNIDHVVSLHASIWDRSSSWATVTNLQREIEKKISYGSLILKCKGGYAYITRGTPFSMRLADEDDSIKRIYINIQVEFLTAI